MIRSRFCLSGGGQRLFMSGFLVVYHPNLVWLDLSLRPDDTCYAPLWRSALALVRLNIPGIFETGTVEMRAGLADASELVRGHRREEVLC